MGYTQCRGYYGDDAGSGGRIRGPEGGELKPADILRKRIEARDTRLSAMALVEVDLAYQLPLSPPLFSPSPRTSLPLLFSHARSG